MQLQHTFIQIYIHRYTRLVACPLHMPDARRGWQAKFGCGHRPIDDNSVASAVAHHELAATADPCDTRDGLAATADQNPDVDSDDDSEDDGFWPGSSGGWAGVYRRAPAIAKPSGLPAEKPHVATLFSGSEAPAAALDQPLPDGYRHVLSCDISDASRQFIKAKFKPEHLFSDIGDYDKSVAKCCVCGRPCDGFL